MKTNYRFTQEEITTLKQYVNYLNYVYGENEAIVFNRDGETKKISYNSLYEQINDLGAALKNLNLKNKNIHVALVAKKSFEWILTYLCTVSGIGTAVLIDPMLDTDSIARKINHSESEIVVFSNNVDYVELAKMTDKVQFFISLDSGNKENCLYIYDLLEEGQKLREKGYNEYINCCIDEDEMCEIIYTSGTTSNPKGVMLSQKNIISVIKAQVEFCDMGKRYLSVLPIHHAYECTNGILAPLLNGATICLNDNISELFNNFKQYKPDTVMLVPVLVNYIYTILENDTYNKALTCKQQAIKEMLGNNLKYIYCGGAMLESKYIEYFKENGILIFNGYGITECAPLIAVNNIKNFSAEAVGKAVPCCQVKIDATNISDVGEILVQGDNVMLGYFNNLQETKKAIQQRWFKTGDLGYMDTEGYLYIVGRKNNLIILSNGKNVYPEELEECIMGIKEVNEVVVYTKKTNNAVKLIAEIYATQSNNKEIQDDILQEIIKNKIKEINKKWPRYRRISKIIFRDTPFNKTATNKIIRAK